MNDIWSLKDKIKNGLITFANGDEVVCFRRKQNGHPRSLKDGISYFVIEVQRDGHLVVSQKSGDGQGWLQSVKVHKMYVIKKSDLREFKLNKLFETKQ